MWKTSCATIPGAVGPLQHSQPRETDPDRAAELSWTCESETDDTRTWPSQRAIRTLQHAFYVPMDVRTLI